nr:unnamed protein product [Callosobruchus chinensis]
MFSVYCSTEAIQPDLQFSLFLSSMLDRQNCRRHRG